MKKIIKILAGIYLSETIISQSDAMLTRSFLRKGRFQQPFDSVNTTYLRVKQTRVYCEGDDILTAQDSSSSSIENIEQAEELCNSTPDCSYISFGEKRILNGEKPAGFTGDILPGTGAKWICKGDGWFDSTRKLDWNLLVRRDKIQESLPNYDVMVNTRTGCDELHRIKKMSRAIDPKEAAEICDNDPSCRFFAIDFESPKDAPNTGRNQTVQFCRGAPLAYENSDGFLVAMKRSMGTETREGMFEESRLVPGEYTPSPFGGSITQDEYFDSKAQGVLIKAKLV